ncbi:PilZ domain-containing protein [Frateuria sp. STR12]|uniref:PilZ domain-containing protein n=1 Tax=Frateuria hangzhouensis TaxID=2995589 RepID=UPI002260AC30|nr:PilZ domain-containing protein [Frateuria sp. STR12]MCX7515103.1 PilZ domain-containing protein [Frateuria sp. STR12]
MTAQVISFEQRRAPRKRAAAAALVTDTIHARPLGHLCNLSASGVLLIAPQRPRSEAVFQARLPLADGPQGAAAIELGLQEQWHQAANAGQVWVGYRIIAIAPQDALTLVQWLQRA